MSGFTRGTSTPPLDDQPLLSVGVGFSRGTATPPMGDVAFEAVLRDDGPGAHTDLAPIDISAARSAPPTGSAAPHRPSPQPAYASSTATPVPATLPDDFLRLTMPVTPASAVAAQATATHHQQQHQQQQQYPQPDSTMQQANIPAHLVGGPGELVVFVEQARLAKNYGLTRMDPFVRLQLGRYERHSGVCSSGGKEPVWNQQVRIEYEPLGGPVLHVEVLDQGTLSDSLVAAGDIDITPLIQSGTPVDEWFTLSGKQGPHKEGTIHLRLVFVPRMTQVMAYPPPPPPAGMMVMGYGQPPMPYAVAPAPPPMRAMPQQQQQQQQTLVVTRESIAAVRDVFPAYDEETVTAVLVANQGNVEATINALLAMG